MKKIAMYGKGGIGKSTVSSNVSAVLGYQGKRVLQVGCDPKHDSTLLLTGTPVVPILEMDDASLRRKEKLLSVGAFGVQCIEIGGPEPGIGCAGRGMLRGIDIIGALGIPEGDFDLIIFDVLGDVVCGGFFAPLKKHADEMYIITSGEFTSLFAANNLCRGYMNNALGHVVLGGIVGNCRGNPGERQLIERFADAVEAPLVGIIEKDSFIEECTFQRIPTIAKDPSNASSRRFVELANNLLHNTGTKKVKPFQLDTLREFFNSARRPNMDAVSARTGAARAVAG